MYNAITFVKIQKRIFCQSTDGAYPVSVVVFGVNGP
jgi:hypothetical protein